MSEGHLVEYSTVKSWYPSTELSSHRQKWTLNISVLTATIWVRSLQLSPVIYIYGAWSRRTCWTGAATYTRAGHRHLPSHPNSNQTSRLHTTKAFPLHRLWLSPSQRQAPSLGNHRASHGPVCNHLLCLARTPTHYGWTDAQLYLCLRWERQPIPSGRSQVCVRASLAQGRESHLARWAVHPADEWWGPGLADPEYVWCV